MTERRVQGLLQDLVNHGHLTIETGGGRHATNRYRPVFEDADSCAPSLDQKRWAKSSNSVSSAETRNPEGHFGVSGRKTPKLAASKPRNQFHPNPYKEPCTPKSPQGRRATMPTPHGDRSNLSGDSTWAPACARPSRRRARPCCISRLTAPDFNPTEKAFSKLKALLRKAAERTVDALWDRIGLLLREFSPTECANFFAAAGYEPV